MVRINVEDGNLGCEIKGEEIEVMVEVARALSAIHQQFSVRDEVMAEVFREGLHEATAPDDPIWELSTSAVVIDKS